MSRRGYAAVGLHLPGDPLNVGHVMRAAGVFGAAMVAVSGSRRFQPGATDTGRMWKHSPLLYAEDLRSVVPYDCVPVAVELLPEAKPLTSYHHPERAFYVFGPENSSLGNAITSWCRDVVYIPAGCLNLSACVNVVLYDRMAKRGETGRMRGAA